jgi:hypothetical protein
LLFLIGETPTSGIHKSALIDALEQIRWLCTTLDRQQNPECQSLPALAPTFSGSTDSIITALEKWRGDSAKWPKRFNMISGSATAINKKKRDRLTELGTDFHATVAPDDEAFGLIVKYLTSVGAKKHQIARLVEGATGYGQTYLGDRRESTEDVLTLSYPLHISQLRQGLILFLWN